MLICDTHADTLWRMATHPEADMDVTREYLTATDDVRVQALALYVSTGGMELTPPITDQELSVLQRLKADGWNLITDVSQARAGVANGMLTIEGCEAFRGLLENVDAFARLGVRIAALTWNNENGLCHPACTGSTEGLTPLGREMVRRMRQLHMAVDTSHLNVRGFFDLLDGTVPPMASHSCAYALCAHPRNLTDDQLRALFDAKGYVGINFYPVFLSDDQCADIDRVIDHMAYMCDLGGEDSVGLGSDFDGILKWPEGLHNAGDVPKLIARMRQRGFGEALTEKIAGKNFEAYMKRI